MTSRSDITPELLRQLLDYDPETGVLTWRTAPWSLFEHRGRWAYKIWRAWNGKYAGKPAFTSETAAGYRQGRILGNSSYAHRVIFAWVYGWWPEEVDHVNGIRNDNRLTNIREVDHLTNSRNSCMKSNNTSGATGVYWEHDAWTVRVGVAGRSLYGGRFASFDAAISVRDAIYRLHDFHPDHGLREPIYPLA